MSLRNYEDLLTVAYVIKVVFDGAFAYFLYVLSLLYPKMSLST